MRFCESGGASKIKILKIFMVFYFVIFLLFGFGKACAEPPSGSLSDYIERERERAANFLNEEKGGDFGGIAEEAPDLEVDFDNGSDPEPGRKKPTSVGEIYSDQLRASGADSIWKNMPDKTKEIIERLGMADLSSAGISELKPEKIIDEFIRLIGENSGGPIKTFTALIGIIIIYAFMSAMKETAENASINKVYEVICALTASAILIIPIFGTINKVRAAAESTSVFMLSFVPVYSGILAASGQAATALSYQTVVLFVTEIVTLAATYFIVPFMTASLTLGVVGSMSPDYRIDKVGETINKMCSWLIGLAGTMFVGLLSLQGGVAASADTLSNRAIRFSLGSFVPVVGGALSEALTTIQGSLGILKSTVGGVGILVNALIVLPPIVECALWLITISFCASLTEMFSLGGLTAIFRVIQSAVKTLIAVLACCGLFMIIATTIVAKAGGLGSFS